MLLMVRGRAAKSARSARESEMKYVFAILVGLLLFVAASVSAQEETWADVLGVEEAPGGVLITLRVFVPFGEAIPEFALATASPAQPPAREAIYALFDAGDQDALGNLIRLDPDSNRCWSFIEWGTDKDLFSLAERRQDADRFIKDCI